MECKREGETERGSWFGRLHLIWPMLFAAGWLLYEFTAQPGLAALVACAKFGWPDVRTAFWLRRVDPDRPRGQTCFWSYLTYGLWKVAVMAAVMMITLGFLNVIFDRLPPRQGGNNGLSPVFGGALAAAGIGFGLSFPIAYLAVWSGWRNGVRIWLGNAPRRAREEHFWPPRDGGINMVPFVGMTTCFMTFLSLTLIAAVIDDVVQPKIVHPVVFALTFLVIAFLALWGVIYAGSRVFARSPHECWIAEEDEQVYQMRTAEERVSEA